jgi:hypothetical protein
VGPRVGLDAVEKRKILPVPGIETGPSSPEPVAAPSELSSRRVVRDAAVSAHDSARARNRIQTMNRRFERSKTLRDLDTVILTSAWI